MGARRPQKAKAVPVYSIISQGSDLYAATRDDIFRASIPVVQPDGKSATTWARIKRNAND